MVKISLPFSCVSNTVTAFPSFSSSPIYSNSLRLVPVPKESGTGMNSSEVVWRTVLIPYRCVWILWANSKGHKVRVKEGALTWKKFNELPSKQVNDPEQLVLTVWSLRVEDGFDHEAHVVQSLEEPLVCRIKLCQSSSKLKYNCMPAKTKSILSSYMLEKYKTARRRTVWQNRKHFQKSRCFFVLCTSETGKIIFMRLQILLNLFLSFLILKVIAFLNKCETLKH